MPKLEKEMTAQDVVEFAKLLEKHGIELWIDGGWGVDALLGEQTRPHEDLDIAVRHRDVQKIRELLESQGYRDIPRDDTSEYNFVLGDDHGHQIDFHSFELNEQGENILGLAYKGEHLKGQGTIDGHQIKTITPEWMVRFHTGYELDENDYHDVRRLCEKYNLPIPAEYNKFKSTS